MSKKRSSKKRRRDGSGSSNEPPHLVLVSDNTSLMAEKPEKTEKGEVIEGSAAVAIAPDSIPPGRASGPSAEELDDEEFFRAPREETPHAFAHEPDHEEAPERPKPSPKMLAAARARREHFSRYVKGAMVAGCAILALAGVRHLVGHSERKPENFAAPVLEAKAAAAAPPLPVAAAAPEPPKAVDVPPPPPEPKVEPKAEPEAPKPAVLAETKPAEAAKAPAPAEPAKVEAKVEAKTEAKPAESQAAEVTTALDPKVAAEAKAESRRQLERGKATAAIEAGERSVAADPTDGEAWLILGAAYQEKGNLKEARRAFSSCAKLGKRGPIGECRAMLTSQ